MSENRIDVTDLNMSDADLFAIVNHDDLESEKITAPRYSYWKSVFRVFFRKKINVVVLSILAALIAFTYIYPAVIGYDATVDPYINLLDPDGKHLAPAAAMEHYGSELKWVLGSGKAGESTFDAIWYGSSSSVSLALICAVINMTVGVIIGAIWGFSKKFDIFMTEVMKGRMFLVAIRVMGVPRQREARLYSRSRMIITCVRIKYAIPIQPVTVSAKTMDQKLADMIRTTTEISRI